MMNRSPAAPRRDLDARWIWWVAVLAATAAMVSTGSAGAGTGTSAGTDSVRSRPHQLERQTISWHACKTGPDDETGTELAAAGARCGEVTVPLDYREPGGRMISIAVARRAATDTAHKLGTLVVKTGGPGPSREGVTAIAKGLPGLSPHGASDLAARYDLVGIDLRFFGLSTPLECGWPTNLAVRFRSLLGARRVPFDAGAPKLPGSLPAFRRRTLSLFFGLLGLVQERPIKRSTVKTSATCAMRMRMIFAAPLTWANESFQCGF